MAKTDRALKRSPLNIDGSSGDDTLTGTSAADTINGLGGNDTIDGLDSADLLYGDDGDDTLYGGDGDDYLIGGTGIDVMDGGAGDDTFYVDDAADVVIDAAGSGNDRVAAEASYALGADAEIELLEAVNTTDTNAMDLTGSSSANLIIGNAGVNSLSGAGGNDTLVGLSGNDFLIGGAGADIMYGGTGDDTYYVDDLGDQANEAAGEGIDRIATSISYALIAGSEIELLEAVNTADTAAMDLTGSDSANIIIGNSGVNILSGAGGNDTLTGLGGNDFLVGGTGNDVMIGGAGSDTFYVDDSGDVVVDADAYGSDRVATSVSYTLGANADIEVLEAVNLADTTAINLTGNGFGQAVIGNEGANVIDGRNGADVLTGAGGADLFAFTTGLGSFNVDRITDFLPGTDKIGLGVFPGLALGALPAGAFVVGTQAGDADDRIIYNSATGQLFFDPDGSGVSAQVLFATLDAGLPLAATDFIVIGSAAAADDGAIIAEDMAVTIDVLANFAGMGTAAIANVGSAAHGTAMLNDNGTPADTSDDTIVYTPNADYEGDDSFTYRVTLSGGTTATGTVAIIVTAVADIADDSVSIVQNSGTNSLDLLANDSFENAGRAIVAVGAAQHGIVAIDDNGTSDDLTDDFVTYTPAAGFAGPDLFTYTVKSGGLTETATVTVNVAAPNFAPAVDLNTGASGIDDTIAYTENGSGVAIGTAIGVTDPDKADMIESATVSIGNPFTGDLLSVSGALPAGISVDLVKSSATTLILVGSATPADYTIALAQILYSSSSDDPTDGGANPARSITVVVDDGALSSAPATSTVKMIAVDDPSVAQDDDFTTDEATAVSGSLFANNGHGADSDPDGTLVINAVNGSAANVGFQMALPSGALLTVNADGTFAYDPNGAFDPTPTSTSGAVNQPESAQFTYELVGGGKGTVTIIINGLDTHDILLGTANGDILNGGIGNDQIFGFGGDDYLVGGSGDDVMTGDLGDDTYYVDSAADAVSEAVGAGNDRVVASASHSLGAGAEVETLEAVDISAATALNLAGNEFANTIIGNDGVNVLSGGGANDMLFGEGGSDFLFGQDGDDFLIGGAGADTMSGGPGNDTYYVDSAADMVNEAVGGGTDRIAASVSYILDAAAEVETLEAGNLGGSNALDLTGNGFANTLIGNNGANILGGGGGADVLIGLGGDDLLVGGAGADLMSGGAGNDTYYVDDSGDAVDEAVGGGTDRIAASVSYFLTAGAAVELVEAVNPSATDAIHLAGNEFDNMVTGNEGVNVLQGLGGDDRLSGLGGHDVLIGGAGNDLLIGGGGSDNMAGGLGNDIYIVEDGGDVVTEAVGEGFDRIAAAVSYTLPLGSEIEQLEAITMGATTELNFTGNELANVLVGNAGINILDGGFGNDILIGLGGADIFAFTTPFGPGNVDHIQQFVSGLDRIALDDALFRGLTAGALPAGAFVTGAAAGEADDRIIYNSATGELFYDADGNGSGAAVLFAALDGHPLIAAGDFIVT